MVANLDFVLCHIDSDRDYWRVPTPPCQCKGGPSDATPTGEPGGAEVPGPVPRCGGGLSPVLSDECELVSVWHECGDIMQHKVDATRREQRCVEV